MKKLIASKGEIITPTPPVSETPEIDPIGKVAAAKAAEILSPSVTTDDDSSDADEITRAEPKASDQLAELRKTLLHQRLENFFGDDADRIIYENGEIDFELLRNWVENQGSDRPERSADGRGSYSRPEISHRPFFDLRA